MKAMEAPQEQLKAGFARQKAGRIEEAESIYLQVLQALPEHPQALQLLGLLRLQQQRLPESLALLQQAARLVPDSASYQYNLGQVYFMQGSLAEAADCFRQVLRLGPPRADIHCRLAEIAQARGELIQAAASYRQALALDPAAERVLAGLGTTLLHLGELQEAQTLLQAALRQGGDSSELHNNLALAFFQQGRLDPALAHIEAAIQLNPADPDILSNQGNIRKARHELGEAIASYRQVVRLNPDQAGVYNNLALALQDQGQPEAAAEQFRIALERGGDSSVFSNLIHCLRAVPGSTEQELGEQLRRWEALYARPLYPELPVFGQTRDPDRRLKIGYVSPDFCQHSAAGIFLLLFAHHDPALYEIYAYSDVEAGDQWTTRFRQQVDHWHQILGLSDADVARLIQADGIDILVDLAGHTANNRLLVFARKPAPVQITGFGSYCSTGLSNMDYLVADSCVIPPESTWCSEELAYMSSAMCWQPSEQAARLELESAPALLNDYTTFGCSTHLFSLNQQVVTVWAEILNRVPGSRLYLKAGQFDDPGTRKLYQERFAACGLHHGQLILKGQTTHLEHMAFYQQIDIALEPFPYQDGVSTCESLWMGVPSLALAGGTRMAESVLRLSGLEELVAETSEAYVDKAVELALDPERLSDWRPEIRQAFAATAVCDAAGFAREVEAIYRRAWRRWASQP
ncbi:MAG: tetratricopeptide repeat protein [Candidatus Sericytochromatia bacterium]